MGTGIFEIHEGCPSVSESACMGPVGRYYTIFGSELSHLIGHFIFSVIIGLVLFGILFFLKRKGMIRLPIYLLALVSFFVIILIFFLLAYILPVIAVY